MFRVVPRTSLDGPIDGAVARVALGDRLESRGRAWLLWSFLLCPCHLPLSLAAVTAVLAGTSFGATFRDNAWIAGSLITTGWIIGTGYGLVLIRQAERAGGACPTRIRGDERGPRRGEGSPDRARSRS